MFNNRAIDFPPLGNPWILGLASAELLRPDQVDDLVALLGDGDRFEEALPDTVLQWCHSVSQANSQFFRFRIEGVLQPDEPRVVQWEAGGSSTDLDLGITAESSTRKLVSILVLAVEGEGVEFQVERTGRSVPAAHGSFVTFPAYSSVRCLGTGDVRVTALAAHAVGPAFT
ncbi:hypothetical protein [Dermatobacter hominis]|uniref:hypothetical protein n=1 Tax=Dermatobacter hominis TaxID=2884263 RepID=UPI001D10DD73|nr:hypothetical protein [Dermatobacter hominis]UDY33959.1 hypothetical protein LH044_11435 [Dermatobacter hominis]